MKENHREFWETFDGKRARIKAEKKPLEYKAEYKGENNKNRWIPSINTTSLACLYE